MGLLCPEPTLHRRDPDSAFDPVQREPNSRATRVRRWGARLGLALLLLLALAGAGFVVWGSTPAGPMPEAIAAMQPDTRVRVETGEWLVFKPQVGPLPTGLIIYPGGRVDPRAYAPVAREIALAGHLVAIVPMPLSLAVLSPDRALDVISAFPEISHWAIGGHSLGGAMAARFAYRHPGEAQGLVLWAAYPAPTDDLSSLSLPAVSIYGTLDGLATVEKIQASRALLPSDTRWVPIEGGNHAQFGWYGAQDGDNPATISREAQQAQVVAATVDLLRRMSAPWGS